MVVGTSASTAAAAGGGSGSGGSAAGSSAAGDGVFLVLCHLQLPFTVGAVVYSKQRMQFSGAGSTWMCPAEM
jgi:hypothetical protein